MKQLTIRVFERLLRNGHGLEPAERDRAIGKGLDDLAGTWTAEEEREFLAAIEPLEQVDEEPRR